MLMAVTEKRVVVDDVFVVVGGGASCNGEGG